MRKLDGLLGAVHGSRLASEEWAAIEALYERVWLDMPARIRHAETLGARWADCTTPFSWFEKGRALATVGVLEHPVRLDGRNVIVAGIHAVCTDPDARGRGLCRRLMQAAIDWAEPQFPLLELSTATPDVYRSVGFRVHPTYRFAVPPSSLGSPVSLRMMNLDDPADLALLRRRMRERAPVSKVFATREPGWLTIIDAALARVTSTWFYDAVELDATIIMACTAEGWIVHDFVAARLPERFPALASGRDRARPAGKQARWGDVVRAFALGLLAPGARPDSGAEEFMVRGPWP